MTAENKLSNGIKDVNDDLQVLGFPLMFGNDFPVINIALTPIINAYVEGDDRFELLYQLAKKKSGLYNYGKVFSPTFSGENAVYQALQNLVSRLENNGRLYVFSDEFLVHRTDSEDLIRLMQSAVHYKASLDLSILQALTKTDNVRDVIDESSLLGSMLSDLGMGKRKPEEVSMNYSLILKSLRMALDF